MTRILSILALVVVLCVVALSVIVRAEPAMIALQVPYPGWEPEFQSTIGFAFSPTRLPGPARSQPRIQVMCYQETALVYGEAESAGHLFTLGGGSSVWWDAPGPVTCIAELYYWSYKGGRQQFEWLADTTFDASDPRSR